MPSANNSVRPMTIADLGRVAALSEQLGYPVALAELERRFARVAPSTSDVLLVAGDPVGGWIHVQERWLLESEDNAEIVALVVDSSIRRSGLGRSLVAAAQLWAKTRGLKRLRVRSNVVREESHRFYPALGFRLSKTQKVYELSSR